ncbi:MAG: Ig-like domain-containing protein [Candidatus Zhuqueibacterota bacterium]
MKYYSTNQKTFFLVIISIVIFIIITGCKKDSPVQPTNNTPYFPDPFQWYSQTQFQYDNVGRMTQASTTITIPAAIDPDGDELSYTWTASNGTILGNVLTGTWQRSIISGRVQSGTVTVVVDDKKGGTNKCTLNFQ